MAAGSDCTHRELHLAGGAQLANDKHIEIGVKPLGHFVCNGNSAARQGQHDHVRTTGKAHQPGGKRTSRFCSVVKHHPSPLAMLPIGMKRYSVRIP